MKEARKIEILKKLNDKGYSTIEELSQLLSVSQSTVRRDLNELTQSNLVAFKKNGVVPISQDITDTPMDYRATVNTRAKNAIARDAIKLIRDGSTIFLDSSSTAHAMASTLKSFQNIIVVTNSLNIVRTLRGCAFPLHLIGGEMSPISSASYGPITESMIRTFNFDVAFFSPVAITPQNYVAETTENAAAVRRAALEQARCNVLMCDHTKLGLVRPYNISHLDAFDYLITDDTKHAFDTTAVVRRVKD